MVLRYTIHGTHQGAFQGIPPTGKQFTVTGITSGYFVNGRCVELRTEFDNLGLVHQLGVIPSMGEGKLLSSPWNRRIPTNNR